MKISRDLKQTGITLLELLLYLAIAAIIFVMAMQYSSTANNNQRLNMVRTMIGADLAALQSFAINNNGFKPTGITLNFNTLVNDGYLSTDPKNITCTGTVGNQNCKQYTPWSQEVAINAASNDQATLSIPLPDITYCQNLQQSYGANMVSCSTNDGSAKINVNTANNATS